MISDYSIDLILRSQTLLDEIARLSDRRRDRDDAERQYKKIERDSMILGTREAQADINAYNSARAKFESYRGEVEDLEHKIKVFWKIELSTDKGEAFFRAAKDVLKRASTSNMAKKRSEAMRFFAIDLLKSALIYSNDKYKVYALLGSVLEQEGEEKRSESFGYYIESIRDGNHDVDLIRRSIEMGERLRLDGDSGIDEELTELRSRLSEHNLNR